MMLNSSLTTLMPPSRSTLRSWRIAFFLSGLRSNVSRVNHQRHDADGELVRVRHVHGDKIHAAVTEVQEEGGIPGQPVELGYKQGRSLLTAEGDGLHQFRSILALATFDFGEFGHQLPVAAVQVVHDRVALRVHAEAVDALLGG